MNKHVFRNKEERIWFVKEWSKIVRALKNSYIDLSKIRLIEEVGTNE